MKTFRGGTAAELIPFRLEDGEDLIATLTRVSHDLNVGSGILAMASGVLSVARLLAPGTTGPATLGVIVEHAGPLAVVSAQGWMLANQPELQMILSRGSELIAGRAVEGCLVRGGLEGLLVRLGNVRLERVSDPATGSWSFERGGAPSEMPRILFQGQAVDPRAVLKVPRELIRKHHVLPLALSGETLIVASADPHNLLVRADLHEAVGMRVQWLEVPLAPLDAAIAELLRSLG